MNYKKGFIRLFVLGLIAAPVISIFVNSDRYLMQHSINFDRTLYAISSSKLPKCAAIIAQNPIKFPELSAEVKDDCRILDNIWNDIKKHQAAQGNINAPVTEKVIRDTLDASVKAVTSSMRYDDMLVYTVNYLFLCLVGLISFLVLRWIIRGFKSK